MKMSLHLELGITGVPDYKAVAPTALAEERGSNR
jgi:hypothetical protein